MTSNPGRTAPASHSSNVDFVVWLEALRLEINLVKPEAVEMNNAVYAKIPGTPGMFQFLHRPAGHCSSSYP